MQNERELNFMTAEELMDQQFLPRKAIVEGFLPVGTYILAGAPKCCKSFLVTQLCWCVAEGVPFLGFQVQQSETLYGVFQGLPICEATFPEGFISLGNGVFRNCSQLQKVALPESLKEIGQMAFFGCNELKEVYIPPEVSKIGPAAFPDGIAVRGVAGSAAQAYAEKRNILFIEN